MEIGKIYDSFDDFQNELKSYEKAVGCVFVKIKVKKLKSDSPYLGCIVYDEIVYGCKQGKRRMPSQSKGSRPVQRTYKIGCQAKIRLAAVERDGRCCLKLSSCHLDHTGHPIGQQYVKVLPESRRPEIDRMLGEILKLPSVSTRDVRSFIEGAQNIKVFSSDVRNMRKKVSRIGSTDDAAVISSVLDEIASGGGKYQFGVTPDDDFRFLAFSTSEMLESLRQFPELLLLDCTYKCNVNNYILMNIICVDNNGQGRPVFHALLHNETQELLSSCLSALVSFYDSLRTNVFFVDKDLGEIGALQSIFPHVNIRLCSFHISSAVKRALQRQNLSSQQVDCIFNLFKEQRVCTDEDKYIEVKEKLIDICPPPVVDYFRKHWWNCPQYWASYSYFSPSFHVTTTNHVESFHQKIKKTIGAKTKLSSCISELVNIAQQITHSRQSNTLVNSISLRYNTKHTSPTIIKIQNHLTPFASKLVIHEYTLSTHTTYNITPTEDKYEITGQSPNSITYNTSVGNCCCQFYIDFCLPCRHIFSLRAFLGLELYYCPSTRFSNTVLSSEDHEIVSLSNCITVPPQSVGSSLEEKYAACRELTKSIDSLLPLFGVGDFTNKLNLFQRLFDLVKEDKPVEILDLSMINNPLVSSPEMSSHIPSTSNSFEPPSRSDSSDHVTTVPDILPTSVPSSPQSLSVSELIPQNFEIVPVTSLPDSVSSLVPDSFSSVKLNRVKVRGRPRQTQNFTRRYAKKSKPSPVPFASKDVADQISRMIAACVGNASIEAPYCINDLKCVEDLHSLVADDVVDMSLVSDQFTAKGWDELVGRIVQKRCEGLSV